MKASLPLAFIILLLVNVLVTSCDSKRQEGITIAVAWEGALKNMMRKGDVSAQVDLKDLIGDPNLYALGAVSELKGEILVLDGLPVIASVQENQLRIDTTFNREATLLVYASVDDWVAEEVPAEVTTKQDLEAYIEASAADNGINTDAPFPFRLRGTLTKADWHVIDWPAGDTEHTHKKHIESGLSGTLEGELVEVLGFYSKHHHAIFTHHSTNMHMHLRTLDNRIVGHLDDLVLGDDVQFSVPRTQ